MAGVRLLHVRRPRGAGDGAAMTRAVVAWERFWFRDVETSTLALFRIAFGVVVVGWTISLAPALYSFFSDDGIFPGHPDGGSGAWGLLQLDSSPAAVTLLYLLLLVGEPVPPGRVQDTARGGRGVRMPRLVRPPRPLGPELRRPPDLRPRLLPDARAVGRGAVRRPVARGEAPVLGVPAAIDLASAADPGPGEPALLLRGLGEGPRGRRGTTGRRSRTRSGSRISSGSRSRASSPTRSSS